MGKTMAQLRRTAKQPMCVWADKGSGLSPLDLESKEEVVISVSLENVRENDPVNIARFVVSAHVIPRPAAVPTSTFASEHAELRGMLNGCRGKGVPEGLLDRAIGLADSLHARQVILKGEYEAILKEIIAIKNTVDTLTRERE